MDYFKIVQNFAAENSIEQTTDPTHTQITDPSDPAGQTETAPAHSTEPHLTPAEQPPGEESTLTGVVHVTSKCS